MVVGGEHAPHQAGGGYRGQHQRNPKTTRRVIVGILIGNLATGAVVAAHDAGADWAVWVGLIAIGALAALALHGLDRSEPAEARSSVAVDPHATTSERHYHTPDRTAPQLSPPGGRRDDRITNDVEVC